MLIKVIKLFIFFLGATYTIPTGIIILDIFETERYPIIKSIPFVIMWGFMIWLVSLARVS